jgi:hypothetical protein
MSEITPNDFENMIAHAGDDSLSAFVEVKTPAYRAVVSNFFHLPVGLMIALKEANLQQDGSDFLILLDAAELSFDEADFERLEDLKFSEFLIVIRAWLKASTPA